MKKDKEWLKQAIRGMCQSRILQSITINVDVLDNLIDQLEEPEQEKVVVNEVMAGHIENCKNLKLTLSDSLHLVVPGDKRKEMLFARAWIEGYSVEQEKVVVPQFVADWIEKNRDKTTLLDTKAMMVQRCVNDDLIVLDWVDDNEELFIRAWLDGYSVEKEKLYRVKVDQGTNYLYVESLHLYSDVINPLDFNYKFSAKEHALKFANRNQAKGVAELVDGEVEEITK